MRSVLVIMILAACAPEPTRSEPPTASESAQTPVEAPNAPAATPTAAPAGAVANDPRWHAT
ncbi:MAG TPA: hypothetical protein VGB85_34060, partial [Nannocystis sp.]